MLEKSNVGKITVRPYAKLLVTYIIITIITILLFAYSYYNVANSIREEKISEMLFSLERDSKVIDEHIVKTKRMLYNLFLDDNLQRIASINTSLTSAQHYWLLDVHRQMGKYELTGGTIAEVLIVFNPNIPFMMTTRQIVTVPYYYYDKALFKYSDMDYQNFTESVIKAAYNNPDGVFLPSRNVDIHSVGSIDVITFVQELRIPGIKMSPVALIFINSDYMKNLIIPFLLGDSGWFCITDVKGEILFEENYSEQLLLKPSDTPKTYVLGSDTVLHVASAETNLSYYVSLPEVWVNDQMRPFWVGFYLVVSITLIVGLAIASLFAYYNIKPVYHIIRKLDSKFSVDKKSRAYDYIEKSFDTIMTSNEEMTDKLEKWSPIIKSGIYERLFKGGIINEQEFQIAPEIKSTITESYRVVTVGWHCYPSKIMQYSLRQIVSSLSDYASQYFNKCVIHPLDDQKAAMLFSCDSFKDEKHMMELMEEITNRLSCQFNMLFAIGIGGEYNEPSLISVSCFEAKKALGVIKDWSGSRVIRYDCFTSRSKGYEFSFEHMDKLYNYILAGDEKSIKILIDQIYNRNFHDKVHNDSDFEQFYDDFVRILDKVSSEMSIENIVNHIPLLSDFSGALEIMNFFIGIFEKVVLVSKSNKMQDSKKLLYDMLDYIESNYNNPDLSLQNIAHRFSMSDKYISLFIKEKTGDNFYKIVEKKRLSKAALLMTETDKSISEISELLGYTSTNTFYKAFRRKYGMSPTIWRDKQAKSSNTDTDEPINITHT